MGNVLHLFLTFILVSALKIITKINEKFLNTVNWQLITKMHNFRNCSTWFFPSPLILRYLRFNHIQNPRCIHLKEEMNYSILDQKMSDKRNCWVFFHKIFLRISGTDLFILNLESNAAILPVFLGSVFFSSLSCTVKLFSLSINLTVSFLIAQHHCLASGKVTHSYILPHKCWAWRCTLTVTYAGVLSLNQALAICKNL